MFVQVFVLEVFLQRLRPARLPAPNRPLEGWAGMYKTAVCRELFLLQKVPQSARENSLADFPSKGASNDKVFRTLRRATKGFAFGNHSL